MAEAIAAAFLSYLDFNGDGVVDVKDSIAKRVVDGISGLDHDGQPDAAEIGVFNRLALLAGLPQSTITQLDQVIYGQVGASVTVARDDSAAGALAGVSTHIDLDSLTKVDGPDADAFGPNRFEFKDKDGRRMLLHQDGDRCAIRFAGSGDSGSFTDPRAVDSALARLLLVKLHGSILHTKLSENPSTVLGAEYEKIERALRTTETAIGDSTPRGMDWSLARMGSSRWDPSGDFEVDLKAGNFRIDLDYRPPRAMLAHDPNSAVPVQKNLWIAYQPAGAAEPEQRPLILISAGELRALKLALPQMQRYDAVWRETVETQNALLALEQHCLAAPQPK